MLAFHLPHSISEHKDSTGGLTTTFWGEALSCALPRVGVKGAFWLSVAVLIKEKEKIEIKVFVYVDIVR